MAKKNISEVINLYKPIGMTPLQAVEEFRKRNPRYKKVKMGYPGKLDPLAEGVLVVLAGDENKKIRNYMKLDKEYVAEILFGFKTDSLDILGIPEKGVVINTEQKQTVLFKVQSVAHATGFSSVSSSLDKPATLVVGNTQRLDDFNDEKIKELKKKLKGLKGNYNFEIPAYSSRRVRGKPLFYYARHGELDKIEIPKTETRIDDIRIIDHYFISGKKLLKEVLKNLDLVDGDFRQDEIKKKWISVLENDYGRYLVMKVVINCSSGTYIRAIARDIGMDYGGGILFWLKRTRVGKFFSRDSVRIL